MDKASGIGSGGDLRRAAAAWRRGRGVAAALLAAAGLWFAGVDVVDAAMVDPPGRVGRIAEADGEVWIWDGEAGEWIAAAPNRPLLEGDRVAVDAERGRAELRIGPTALRLDRGTELVLRTLDDRALGFDLLHGSLALRVPTLEHARQTAVETPEGRFEPLTAGHYRFDRDDEAGVTRATAWRGALQFSGSGNLRRIDAGEAIDVRVDRAAGVARTQAVPLERDPFGEWALAADRAGGAPESYRYVSPEVTGADELDRYGRWDMHPEYGAVWIPFTVPIGWAPYRDGRWVWMRPWGWTWVDAAPWGFAPSHYGRWVRWSGRWCWWPGAYVAQPVFSPALVAWVGGPSVGLTLSIGGPPLGAWTLLGPYDAYRPVVLPRSPRYPQPPHGSWPRYRDRDRDHDRGGVRPPPRPGGSPWRADHDGGMRFDRGGGVHPDRDGSRRFERDGRPASERSGPGRPDRDGPTRSERDVDRPDRHRDGGRPPAPHQAPGAGSPAPTARSSPERGAPPAPPMLRRDDPRAAREARDIQAVREAVREARDERRANETMRSGHGADDVRRGRDGRRPIGDSARVDRVERVERAGPAGAAVPPPTDGRDAPIFVRREPSAAVSGAVPSTPARPDSRAQPAARRDGDDGQRGGRPWMRGRGGDGPGRPGGRDANR